MCPLPALRQMGPQCQRHHANKHRALGPSLRFHASLFHPLLSLEIQTGSCREAMRGSGALWWTCALTATLSPSSASHSKTLVCTDLWHRPTRCLTPLPLRHTEIHSCGGSRILHCHPGYSTFTTQAHTLKSKTQLCKSLQPALNQSAPFSPGTQIEAKDHPGLIHLTLLQELPWNRCLAEEEESQVGGKK